MSFYSSRTQTITTLFVANFDEEVEEDDLEVLFQRTGEVVGCKVFRDWETHRSRGFGFVTMGSREMAEDAVETLNGKYWRRQRLKVAISRDEQ